DVIEALHHVPQRHVSHTESPRSRFPKLPPAARAHSSFRGTGGEAGEVVVHPEGVDDRRRGRPGQGARHPHPPLVNISRAHAIYLSTLNKAHKRSTATPRRAFPALVDLANEPRRVPPSTCATGIANRDGFIAMRRL